MADEKDFSPRFHELTGVSPLSWQRRLYEDYFTRGSHALPDIIDLPTGLGKTMVMAIWLIALEKQLNVPTRLIYVVDRRTVVDQATDLAETLRCKFGKDKLAISTLRGQLADNREWSTDPSKPAIIIGTVDLIGSALLFSGYRSSYKRRPLEAGLLGQDSLLLLDEAHLSRPFEKLVKSICRFQERNTNPMRVIRMSATSSEADSNAFQLTDSDFNDPIISQRVNAKKRLTVNPNVDAKKVNEALADAAIGLATDPQFIGKRIVVFVRRPDDARAIADSIRSHTVESIDSSSPKQKKIKTLPYDEHVQVLTGTMRGLERDELVEKNKVFKDRWLNGNLDPSDPANQHPVFLISTSAGEVGFDLNADHLIGDSAPIDSWIQRLGRVNRRGNGNATVILIKQEKPADKTDFDNACIAAANLLTDGMDLSPSAIAEFKKTHVTQLKAASTPEPATVELTDILVDAWSMTSIVEPMPGRPEVGPWLRGLADDLPQTIIAWRADLDEPGFAELDTDTIEEWFDTHRVLTHETLSVPTSVAAKWFIDRWNELADDIKSALNDKLAIVDRAGLEAITIHDLVAQLSRKSGDITAILRNADIILPASFGGIKRGNGLLDATEPQIPKDEKQKPIEEQREAHATRLIAPDVADVAPGLERLRQIITKPDGGEPETPRTIGNGTRPERPLLFRVELRSDDDQHVTLASYIPRREKPEFESTKPETLASHVGKVRQAVDAIIARIRLPDDIKQSDIIRKAAQLAADFHDEGKKRERWQRLLVLQPGVQRPDGLLAKSGWEMKRDPRGYRHEFGSLREFIDAFHAGKLVDDGGNPITQEVFDPAVHLIASHHARSRPHFPRGGFDPGCESRSDAIHIEAIRRFARLQCKYGWWHLAWLENLLRCADAIASADRESDKIDESAEAKAGAK